MKDYEVIIKVTYTVPADNYDEAVETVLSVPLEHYVNDWGTPRDLITDYEVQPRV